MNTTYRGYRASDKPRCNHCGGFIDASIRQQRCGNCSGLVLCVNGDVVEREPRLGTEV